MSARDSQSNSIVAQEEEEKRRRVFKLWILEIPIEWASPIFIGLVIGFGICYFLLFKSPLVIDPLISNAVRATVAAQTPAVQFVSIPAPTHTPYPTNTPNSTSTPYPTFTPQAALPTYTPVPSGALPSAQIVKPQFSDGTIPVQTDVSVAYQNIPVGKYLWVVVRVPKVEPNWLVYPQLLGGIPKPVNNKNGTLTTRVQLGKEGKPDAGLPFNIIVLLLDDTAQQTFLQYSEQCNSNPDNPLSCSGLALPETGVQILDFNTVIRK